MYFILGIQKENIHPRALAGYRRTIKLCTTCATDIYDYQCCHCEKLKFCKKLLISSTDTFFFLHVVAIFSISFALTFYTFSETYNCFSKI